MTPLEALDWLVSQVDVYTPPPDLIAAEDTIRAALSPRVVTTATELDALPHGTIVLDGWEQDRDAWRWDAGVGYWYSTSRIDRDGFQSRHVIDMGPATVVWTPPLTPGTEPTL